MKRYLFLILLIFIVALTACNDNDNNKTNGSDSGHFVEFTTEMLNIYTYQLEKLPINTNADMESVTITSSDDAVAKVENLMIMPYSAGSVTITATLSNGKTDSLVVNVEEDGNVPYLEVSDLSIKLFENSSYVLDTYVKLRGKKVEATYTFKSSDSSIATIDENGKIVALKSGAVDINVIANYNGYTGNELYSLSRTVTLEVIPSVILSISSEKTAINNRTDIINNVNYSNETSLSGTIYVDGEYKDILNSNVEWVSSNSSVAKVVDNKIVGLF